MSVRVFTYELTPGTRLFGAYGDDVQDVVVSVTPEPNRYRESLVYRVEVGRLLKNESVWRPAWFFSGKQAPWQAELP